MENQKKWSPVLLNSPLDSGGLKPNWVALSTDTLESFKLLRISFWIDVWNIESLSLMIFLRKISIVVNKYASSYDTVSDLIIIPPHNYKGMEVSLMDSRLVINSGYFNISWSISNWQMYIPCGLLEFFLCFLSSGVL